MIQLANYSDVGGRPDNEDSIQWTRAGEDALCLVVADGLGGHGGGKIASAAAAETICAGWDGTTDREKLKALALRAHEAVLARQEPACAMKSTVAALTLTREEASWIHAGDTRLYHFIDGALAFQTRDHSASQIAVVLGEITPDQIRFHEDRSRVLKALGQEGDLIVEPDGAAMTPGRHAFLLCTDGFWEYVLEKEMEEDLCAAKSPEDWIARMRKRHRARIPNDNDNNSAAAVWLEK
ncbi:MAG: protein phosphatase 2C domain-containing protein [Clostridiales bacterium]|nr:protein phosphatase 2C domain-containing protein [Clostridiales bacterium]